MTAHPVDGHDPDDPVGILSVLPEEYHAQFLIEYAAAVEGARRPEQFRQLQELLRLWRLRAWRIRVLDMTSGWQPSAGDGRPILRLLSMSSLAGLAAGRVL